ncbi:hypothetical protein C6W64_012510 [Blautia sp. SG-772]|nr:hypothetical protein C6W64_012510 [Blautia sp. SG-772]
MTRFGIIQIIYNLRIFCSFCFQINGINPALRPVGIISIEEDEKKQLLNEIRNSAYLGNLSLGFFHNKIKQRNIPGIRMFAKIDFPS